MIAIVTCSLINDNKIMNMYKRTKLSIITALFAFVFSINVSTGLADYRPEKLENASAQIQYASDYYRNIRRGTASKKDYKKLVALYDAVAEYFPEAKETAFIAKSNAAIIIVRHGLDDDGKYNAWKRYLQLLPEADPANYEDSNKIIRGLIEVSSDKKWEHVKKELSELANRYPRQAATIAINLACEAVCRRTSSEESEKYFEDAESILAEGITKANPTMDQVLLIKELSAAIGVFRVRDRIARRLTAIKANKQVKKKLSEKISAAFSPTGITSDSAPLVNASYDFIRLEQCGTSPMVLGQFIAYRRSLVQGMRRWIRNLEVGVDGLSERQRDIIAICAKASGMPVAGPLDRLLEQLKVEKDIELIQSTLDSIRDVHGGR